MKASFFFAVLVLPCFSSLLSGCDSLLSLAEEGKPPITIEGVVRKEESGESFPGVRIGVVRVQVVDIGDFGQSETESEQFAVLSTDAEGAFELYDPEPGVARRYLLYFAPPEEALTYDGENRLENVFVGNCGKEYGGKCTFEVEAQLGRGE